MPVHIQSSHGDLRLTLSNGDTVIDTQVAATPQEANRVAIMMIASRDAFDIGDDLLRGFVSLDSHSGLWRVHRASDAREFFTFGVLTNVGWAQIKGFAGDVNLNRV